MTTELQGVMELAQFVEQALGRAVTAQEVRNCDELAIITSYCKELIRMC